MKLHEWMLEYQKENNYPDLVLTQDWALRAAKLEFCIKELEAELKKLKQEGCCLTPVARSVITDARSSPRIPCP